MYIYIYTYLLTSPNLLLQTLEFNHVLAVHPHSHVIILSQARLHVLLREALCDDSIYDITNRHAPAGARRLLERAEDGGGGINTHAHGGVSPDVNTLLVG